MSILINPGSHIAAHGVGWTNTYQQALQTAEQWHAQMTDEGIRDVTLVLDASSTEKREGRWTFTFRHDVTGVEAKFETHGIDDIEAYQRDHIFAPRIYWNGSSSENPHVSDWKADGFEVVKTLRPVGSTS